MKVGPLILLFVAACGSKRSFDDGVGDGDVFMDFDGSLGSGDGAPPGPCVNLGCQIVPCGGGGHTTISGTVYDPAGKNPLYNVYVYVPNAPLSAIPPGPACTACQAPASGSPLVGTQTDPKGHFTLGDVPVGANIPLVMQLGKFRRVITIPEISQCVDNPIVKDLTRLPRKQAENDPFDNMPKIAVATGGCDSHECLLRKIGIDDSEITDPNGHVRIFKGTDSGKYGGATTSYATSAQDTLWSSQSELGKYDIILNSCECYPFDRKTAYSTVHDYVNGGGRLFGTHYHYNWFAPPGGASDFQSTAEWLMHTTTQRNPFYIDTSFPKGQALDQWIHNIFNGSPPGQIALKYSALDAAHVKGSTTRWIYYGDQQGSNYGTSYLSFNTPVQAQPKEQCGRAVFSDLHVSEDYIPSGQQFPQECNSDPMTEQEAALEFLFFDLSSCIGDDSKPPPPPPPN